MSPLIRNYFKAVALSGGNFAPPGTFGNVWRHSGLTQPGVGQSTTDILWVEARVLLNIPQSTGQPPATNYLLAQNFSYAQVDICHFKGAPL